MVLAVAPQYALAGERPLTVTVVGNDLGTELDTPSSVAVGGIACGSPVVINSSAVQCTLLAP